MPVYRPLSSLAPVVPQAPLEDVSARIRAQGARATPARIAVLRMLQTASRALSHADVEHALADSGFDRVTLYRVLDWLVEAGLAHRVADSDRVFRFSLAASRSPEHARHAHFRCDDCGRVFCLEDVRVSTPVLPAGFTSKEVQVSVSGACAECNARPS
ncbi:MAG: Fur family transcriptional regulator [Moraxellaceae bacterium]|nr:Fur family transcriptional regulator [Moraxellaceae bacterium]